MKYRLAEYVVSCDIELPFMAEAHGSEESQYDLTIQRSSTHLEFEGDLIFERTPSSGKLIFGPSWEASEIINYIQHQVVPEILSDLGYHCLHASVVRGKEGYIVFTGLTGSGKSTVAYLMSKNGYDMVADEVIGFRATANGLEAYVPPQMIRFFNNSEILKHYEGLGEAWKASGLFVDKQVMDWPGSSGGFLKAAPYTIYILGFEDDSSLSSLIPELLKNSFSPSPDNKRVLENSYEVLSGLIQSHLVRGVSSVGSFDDFPNLVERSFTRTF